MLFATPTVKMATLVLAPSAGRTAPVIRSSVTMVLTATNPMPMAEVLARSTSCMAVKSGVPYGTSLATKASIMSAAASALPTALAK